MLTVQEVIAAVQAGDPDKPAAVIAQAWDEKNKGNSSIKIWDGARHYEGKTLEGAFALYLVERHARKPAAQDAELENVIGALPQEETAVQP